MAIKRALVALAVAACAALLWHLWAHDPSAPGANFIPCVFHLVTGLNCPGCGATRAVHALLHGDVAAAFGFNPLFVVSLPFLVALGVHATLVALGKARPRRPLPPRFWYALVVVLLAFGVARNVLHIDNL